MSNKLFLHYQKTDIGTVGIAECGGCITHLFFEPGSLLPDAEILETMLISEAFRQLNSYLAGKLKRFSLPLSPPGTPFMQDVWNVLCTIPYGTTVTYKEIAAAVGNPLAVRAVGMANHRNTIPLFIPCHRVIGSDGTLTGYRGGLALKKHLLELEQSFR
jgi:methylated-DNA-[protein]-cysteine S-methyltransferase